MFWSFISKCSILFRKRKAITKCYASYDGTERMQSNYSVMKVFKNETPFQFNLHSLEIMCIIPIQNISVKMNQTYFLPVNVKCLTKHKTIFFPHVRKGVFFFSSPPLPKLQKFSWNQRKWFWDPTVKNQNASSHI